jgi:HSP20 family protein
MTNRDLTPWTSGGLTSYGRDPFSMFRREMDRLFDDFFAPSEPRSFGGPAASRPQAALIRPSIDIEDQDHAYVVTAELPGLSEKDVELSLNDNVLTISGEKRSERKEEKAGRHYTERSFGRFERTIPLPVEVDAERVDASFRNGVLTVALPKTEKARQNARRIEIRAGGPGDGGGQAPSQTQQ